MTSAVTAADASATTCRTGGCGVPPPAVVGAGEAARSCVSRAACPSPRHWCHPIPWCRRFPLSAPAAPAPPVPPPPPPPAASSPTVATTAARALTARTREHIQPRCWLHPSRRSGCGSDAARPRQLRRQNQHRLPLRRLHRRPRHPRRRRSASRYLNLIGNWFQSPNQSRSLIHRHRRLHHRGALG